MRVHARVSPARRGLSGGDALTCESGGSGSFLRSLSRGIWLLLIEQVKVSLKLHLSLGEHFAVILGLSVVHLLLIRTVHDGNVLFSGGLSSSRVDLRKRLVLRQLFTLRGTVLILG